MARLAGKIGFITGAGTGIGRATAIRFARKGAKVAIAEIHARAGEETAHLAGNEAITICTGVTPTACNLRSTPPASTFSTTMPAAQPR
jgi:NAD(P)-dependent dehydrogenase (short-subunit alcohol dehydrogenase family)